MQDDSAEGAYLLPGGSDIACGNIFIRPPCHCEEQSDVAISCKELRSGQRRFPRRANALPGMTYNLHFRKPFRSVAKTAPNTFFGKQSATNQNKRDKNSKLEQRIFHCLHLFRMVAAQPYSIVSGCALLCKSRFSRLQALRESSPPSRPMSRRQRRCYRKNQYSFRLAHA